MAKRRWCSASALVAFGMLVAGWSFTARTADNYPTHPIRVIVPYGAGGSYDLIARVIGQKLSEQLGQQLVVDDRPGAAGRIGMELAVRSAPDGYTLIVLGNTQVIVSTVYRKVPYDLQRDIVPLTTVATITNTLIVNPALPVKSIGEFIAYTKSHPGQIRFGSGGTGGITHLAGELFKSLSGADVTHVPYKAGVFANSAVMSGEVQMVFLNAYGAIPLVEANKVRILAVTGLERSRFFPNVPTLDESGLKGYELQEFHGIALPAGAPAPLVKRLYGEISKALSAPDVIEKLTSQAAERALSSPDDFKRMLKSEHDKYEAIVKAVGITPE